MQASTQPAANWTTRTAANGLLFALLSCGAACSSSGGFSPPETSTGPGSPIVAPDTQLVPQADPGSSLPSGWMNKGMLQVYVRGYQDSNGDGVGDLRGLISRLDYIKELGVGGIWLMPVNASQDRDHGYAVVDYRAIEADYGSLADMDELLRQAHVRGLGVIMDYVINHSAATHPAFVASASPTSPYRDWYLWQNPKPNGWAIYGSDPWRLSGEQAYFAPFSGTMPDFNLRNRAVVDWHLNNLRFWLNRGVDGFRFDAVGHLVENGPNAWDNQAENHAVMSEVRALTQRYDKRYIVCEGPGAPRAFAASNSCASAFAFGHNTRLLAAARGDASALTSVAAYPQQTAPEPAQAMATFLANHDAFAGWRVFDQLGGNLAQYRLAASLLLLQPGVPFIYYGEEIGMSGGTGLSGDWSLRTPMSWTGEAVHAGFSNRQPFRALSANAASHNVATERANPNGLLAHYKALFALRGSRPSLSQGGYSEVRQSGSVLSFSRQSGVQTTWVALNTGGQSQRVVLTGFAPNARVHALMAPPGSPDASADAQGRLDIELAPHSTWVFGN